MQIFNSSTQKNELSSYRNDEIRKDQAVYS